MVKRLKVKKFVKNFVKKFIKTAPLCIDQCGSFCSKSYITDSITKMGVAENPGDLLLTHCTNNHKGNDASKRTPQINIGGFHLYLFELAFINQFYSRMTGLFQQSLANDKFRNHFAISSKYFDMACY